MKTHVILLVLLAMIGLSCTDAGNPVQEASPGEHLFFPPGGPNYVSGEVILSFNDSVNYSFIVLFFSRLNLEPVFINADSAFTMWIQVDSGEVAAQVARLLLDSTVIWAEQTGFDGGDPDKPYILAHFRGITTTDRARALIGSIGGLSWKQTMVSMRLAVAKVEVGQEQHWVDSLKVMPAVKWAELVQIIYVATESGTLPHSNAVIRTPR